MKSINHVYVLGAGASAASGRMPVGVDLVWNYSFICGLDGHFKNYREFLVLAASIYPDLKHLPDRWDTSSNYNLFYVYECEKKHYVDEMLEKLHNQGNHAGIELVRWLIFEHLAESTAFMPKGNLYQKFGEIIKKDRETEYVSIISFNFDSLLHEDCSKGIYYDYVLEFDSIADYRRAYYKRSNPVKLIKPNGSLDWMICPSCNSLHLYNKHVPRNSYEKKSCEKCGKAFQPYIIIPHERYDGPIESLWTSAGNELRRADKVTVIGYSFPQYDTKVIELFANSLRPDTKLEVVTICEPDIDEDYMRKCLLTRHKQLFPAIRSEIQICLNGFEGYINSFDTENISSPSENN